MRLRDVVPLVLAFAAIAVVGALRGERGAQAPATYSTYDAEPGGYRAWYELLQLEGIGATRFDERAAFLDAGIGTVISLMIPYAVIVATVWILFFVAWYLLGIPLGPGAPIRI